MTDGAPSRKERPFKASECPICGKPSTPESHPFCSPRCAKVDLNRWLSGGYFIPGAEVEDEDGEGKGADPES